MNHFYRSTLNLLLHLQHRRQQESGYSLVVTLVAILLLGTLLVTAALVSKVDSSSTTASTSSNSGFYAAEAGLNLRANDVRADFVGFNRPSGDSEASTWEDCIDSDPNNDGEGDFVCDSSITINGQQIVTFVDDVTEESAVSTPITDGPFAGLNSLEYRYDLMSVALKTEGEQASPTSILGMRFKSRLIPVFQFAAFFEDDLAFTIPPSMVINGRVHSNNDIYLNSGGGTLAITGRITTPGSLYRGEKTVSDDCRTTVTIFDGSNQSSLACGSGNTTRAYTQSQLAAWGDNILIGSEDYKLQLPEMTNYQMPPDNVITDPDEREDYVYWEKADMRLVLQLDDSNNPTGINIVNVDGTEDFSATTGLNSCAPVSTSLRQESPGDNNYEIADVDLNVQSTSNFSEGDRIIIGDDLDSNVISSVTSSDSMTIRRQLGHSYQTSGTTTIASNNDVVKKAVVSTSDTFYNYREKNGATGVNAGRFIRMLDVDVQELIDCIDSNVSGSNGLMGNRDLDDETEGGLVWFFAVNGPDSHNNVETDAPNNYGIRLYNARELDSSNSSAKNIKGLTIVTDQAVYTQGHYNSVNKIPAAIISDSYNVLSTAWNNDDSNGRLYNSSNLQDTTSATRTEVTNINIPCYGIYYCTDYGDEIRDADNTTINAALFNGQDLMGGGNGSTFQNRGKDTDSGGVNNFPRMHEDWTGSTNCPSGFYPGRCTLTYEGSMVSFGQSQRVNGEFCGAYYDETDDCNIYTPPVRDWRFDESFEQAQNLPPLTPRAVSVTQEVFERDFTYTSSIPQGFLLSSLYIPSQRINSNHQKRPFLSSYRL